MKEFSCKECGKKFSSNDALGMHTKAKHPGSHNEPKLSAGQKKRIRKYGIAILIVIAILGFIYWMNIPPKDAPVMVISPASHDFGTVSQAAGKVSAMMTINNDGTEDLVISKIETSCGCTSATITYEGKESPSFGMPGHGMSAPSGWRQVIPPGGEAQLKVTYDPNVHKDMRGPVSRIVSIYSNDPRNSVKAARISAVQVN